MSAFAPPSPTALGGPLVVWENAFSVSEVERIVALGEARPLQKAELFVDLAQADKIRVTDVAWLGYDSETDWLYRRLGEIVQRLNIQFYKYELKGLLERLQFTVYHHDAGGHYRWHVDHGHATAAPRKLSLSLQLSDPASYQGCDLEVNYGDGECPTARAQGAIIAFPSYVLHRVTPITQGTRKSLVIWANGPDFR